MSSLALPPGAELVGGMKLPPGAELVHEQDAQPKESFLGGVWKNVNPIPILKSIAESSRSPYGIALGPGGTMIDLARKHLPGIIETHAEQARKAKQSYDKGNYSESAGHALAALLPVVGPAAAGAAETMTGTEPEMDKFGNITKPGTEPNLAGGLGEATGLLLPFGGPVAGAAGRGVKAGLRAAGAPEMLRAAAESGYGRVLNPTTKANKSITARVVPELLDRGVTSMTMKGLKEQAQSHIDAVGSAIGDAWDNLPAGTKTDFEPVYQKLQEAIEQAHSVPDSSGKLIPKGPEAERAIGNIEKLQQTLLDVAEVDPSGKIQIPVDKVHVLKQYFDDIAARAGRYGGKDLADSSAAEAHGLAADAMRNELALDHPEIAALNKEYSFWKNVHKVVSDTVERRQGQAKPLGRKMARAAGQAAGFVEGGVHGAILGGAAMDALEAATSSPAWKTVSAVLKSKLADAIASGNQPGITLYSKQAQAATESLSATISSDVTEQTAGQAGQGRTGAEIQGPTGSIPGSTAQETSVLIPGEDRPLPAHYALRELSDMQTSHNGVTFLANPKYGLKNDRDYSVQDNQAKVLNGAARGKFDPRYHITDNPDATNGPIVINSRGDALGGNGRGMMLQRVYATNPEGSAAYRALLEQRAAQFGIDPAHVKGMKQPVLVRKIADDAVANSGQAAAAITDLNKTGTASLRPAERAIADSRRVSQSTLEDISNRLDDHGPTATLANILDGKSGAEVLNKMIQDGVISPQERAQYASGDTLTQAGKTRISQLMLGRFFRDPAQLDTIAPAIKAKLERVAAPLAATEAIEGWGMTPEIQKALDLIESARGHGMKNIDMYVQQSGLFGKQQWPAETLELSKSLQRAKSEHLKSATQQYVEKARYAQQYQGPGIFNNFPEPDTPSVAFQQFLKDLKYPAAKVGKAMGE